MTTNTNGSVRKVNDLPASVDLYADQYLTDFSLRYRQDQARFVAPLAATPIPVMKETGIYRTFPRGYFWRDEAEIRPLGGRPVQVGYKTGQERYFAEEWALEHTIDDRQRTNAVGQYDLDEAGVSLLEGKMMIREDRIWAETAFKPDVWAYDYTGGADFDPFDDDASDPVRIIDKYKTALGMGSGFEANTVVLGANVNMALRTNPAMVDRIKYTQTGIVTNQLLAALFEVDNVRVAKSVYNAAEEGADDDFRFIVDPNAIWIGHVAATPALDTPTAIARFGWAGLVGANRVGGVIRKGRDDRAKSDWIQDTNAFDIKVVAPDLGIFLTGASANG